MEANQIIELSSSNQQLSKRAKIKLFPYGYSKALRDSINDVMGVASRFPGSQGAVDPAFVHICSFPECRADIYRKLLDGKRLSKNQGLYLLDTITSLKKAVSQWYFEAEAAGIEWHRNA